MYVEFSSESWRFLNIGPVGIFYWDAISAAFEPCSKELQQQQQLDVAAAVSGDAINKHINTLKLNHLRRVNIHYGKQFYILIIYIDIMCTVYILGCMRCFPKFTLRMIYYCSYLAGLGYFKQHSHLHKKSGNWRQTNYFDQNICTS